MRVHWFPSLFNSFVWKFCSLSNEQSLHSFISILKGRYINFDWLVDWLIDLLIDRLIDWLIYWLIDWLIDWLVHCFHFNLPSFCWYVLRLMNSFVLFTQSVDVFLFPAWACPHIMIIYSVTLSPTSFLSFFSIHGYLLSSDRIAAPIFPIFANFLPVSQRAVEVNLVLSSSSLLSFHPRLWSRDTVPPPTSSHLCTLFSQSSYFSWRLHLQSRSPAAAVASATAAAQVSVEFIVRRSRCSLAAAVANRQPIRDRLTWLTDGWRLSTMVSRGSHKSNARGPNSSRSTIYMYYKRPRDAYTSATTPMPVRW